MRAFITLIICMCTSVIILTGCSDNNQVEKDISQEVTDPLNTPDLVSSSPDPIKPEDNEENKVDTPDLTEQPEQPEQPQEAVETVTEPKVDNPQPVDNGPAVQVIAEPDVITVLVNKQYALPKDYSPAELVYPNIDYIFSEKIDKRKLRKEAAEAIELLFAGAAEDEIKLLGVSAYRSNATQKALFERYVKRDGEAKARTYSAVPGHSEHETGLAIDVTGGDGKCAATDCFGDTEEAAWLAEHAAEYGFIIRYPKGKQDITGYKYEPWHLRYVGLDVATEIAANNLTMEEYYDAVPVSE